MEDISDDQTEKYTINQFNADSGENCETLGNEMVTERNKNFREKGLAKPLVSEEVYFSEGEYVAGIDHGILVGY